MKYLLKIHIICCCLFCSLPANATHIVGGEMTYVCLGDDLFEISLTIFRDCVNGEAEFDNPADIGIYDGFGTLVDSLEIPFIRDDTLSEILTHDCFVIPPNVCVHTTTYTSVVELQPQIGGYEIIYQRCCRNGTIVNIVTPLDSGATYGVTISESALLECNSSATFQTWPPIYICANQPIYFDQSAFDIDGDSIVYSLCTPLLGASADEPQPEPFEQTIPVPLSWIDPPYNLDNVLGGIPLQIDPQTGLLTGTPNTIGQFVVGICLEEYRDGELISTTRRDFQYNVGECNLAYAAFFSPEIQCDDLEVFFDNNSANANNFYWEFNDPAYPDTSSTEINPSFVFSDTGTYQVMLIAQPGICADTFEQSITLLYSTSQLDFNVTEVNCNDTLLLHVEDASNDPLGSPLEWNWLLDSVLVADAPEADISITNSGLHTLQLELVTANGCPVTIDTTFFVDLISEELVADSLFICHGDTVALNPIPDSSYVFNWNADTDISDTLSLNPLVSPDSSTLYQVTISDPATGCAIFRSIFVELPEQLEVIIPPDTTTCTPELYLTAESAQAVQFFWSDDAAFENILSDNDSLFITPFGANTYYIVVTDQFGCRLFDSVQIVGHGINIEADSFHLICDGESVLIGVENIDPADILSYEWLPAAEISGSNTDSVALVTPPEPGLHYYTVLASNQYDCTLLDSISVNALDTTNQADFVSSNQCSNTIVQFTNTSINAAYYTWYFGDPENPGASSTLQHPVYEYPVQGDYLVTLIIEDDVNCRDTIAQLITVGAPMINVVFTWNYISCGDSIVLQFTDLSTNTQSTFTERNWSFGNGITTNIANPEIVMYTGNSLDVALSFTSSDGCEDHYFETIPLYFIEDNFADSLFICHGDSINLNPDYNALYSYHWEPAETLLDPDVGNPIAFPTTSQQYQVTISTVQPFACEITRSVFVEVSEPIVFTMIEDTSICSETIELFVETTEAYEILWSDSPLYNNVLSNDETIQVLPERESHYYVQLTDSLGCFVNDQVQINGNRPIIAVEDLYTVCIGDSVEVNVFSAYPEDTLSYEWYPEDGLVSGQGTGSAVLIPGMSDQYTVMVTNQFGCMISDSFEVAIFEYLPPLEISADPETIYLSESTQLDATLNEDYIYSWQPATFLSENNIANPVATPPETTRYELVIQNQDGCMNRDTILITVVDPICDNAHIFLPNAFSPNGDGENDELQLYGEFVEEMYLVIYNRWGQKIFESYSQTTTWDGTFKGQELPPDVFAFYLKVKCINGEEYSKQGNITLLR